MMTQTELSFHKDRPKRHSLEVLRETARIMAEKVVEGWANHDPDENIEVVVEDLMEAMDRCTAAMDGYALCRALENYSYWDPDAELVDILDGADLLSVHTRMVKAWVATNAIKPSLDVGMSVITPRGNGVLTVIYEDMAEYGVSMRINADQIDHTYIFPYECVNDIADLPTCSANSATHTGNPL